MSYVKDLPVELEEENGCEISVKKLDDMDFIFSIEDDVFGEEFFHVKKPYQWKKKIVSEIQRKLGGGADTKIRIKKEFFSYMGKPAGKLIFLDFVKVA